MPAIAPTYNPRQGLVLPASTPWQPAYNPMEGQAQIDTTLNAGIPGYSGLVSQAADQAGTLMSGMPSASMTRRDNAYFGTASGMPSSDFVRNRGFDLYGEKAEGYKQRGFDDFLKLLSGTVGKTTQDVSQNNQASQYQQSQNVDTGRSFANSNNNRLANFRNNRGQEYSSSVINPQGQETFQYKYFA